MNGNRNERYGPPCPSCYKRRPPRLFQREGVEVGGLIISAYIPPPPQPKEKSRGKESGDGHCKMLEAGVLEPRYNPHPLPSSFRVNC